MRISVLSLLLCIALNVYSADDKVSPPPLSVYGKLPGVEMMALSPSGELLASVTTVGERRALIIGRMGGEILYTYSLGEIKTRQLRWAGDNYLIVSVSSTQNLGIVYGGKHELSNLMIVDVKKGEEDWPLYGSKKVFNASFYTYLPVKADGRWHQCLATLPMNSSIHSGAVWISDNELDLSCVDLNSGKRRVIARGRRDGEGWAIAPGLNLLAYETYDDIKRKWQLKRYEDHATLVSSEDKYGSNQLFGLGRTRGTVLYSHYDEDGGFHLMEIAVDGKSEPVELYRESIIQGFLFDDETGLFIGGVKDGDVPELEMVSAGLEKIVRATRKAFPDNNVHFKSASTDWLKLIVYTDGASDSGTWWFVDIAKGDAHPIGYDRPEIRSVNVGAEKMWEYKAHDGLTIPAVLTTPPGWDGGAGMPLVVLPHGGPQSRDYLGFDWLAQAFASRGYVVLQPNFRGSSGYGVAYRNAGFGERGRKMQTDLSDGVAALAKTGLIDPERVCIVGASYGGYAALAGVTVQSGIYQCAVSIAGVSDLPMWLGSFEFAKLRGIQRYVGDYLGVNSSRADELEEISPAYLAAKADAPILLIHGRDDTVVPVVHSEKMYSRLKRRKKIVEFVELESEDHHLSRSETRQKALDAAVTFVMKHNPPESVPIAE